MNEQIKKLMLEAGYAAPELAGRANRLVELMVKECVSICEQATAQGQNTKDQLQEDELAERMVIHGAIHQAERLTQGIRQHFGVEQ